MISSELRVSLVDEPAGMLVAELTHIQYTNFFVRTQEFLAENRGGGITP